MKKVIYLIALSLNIAVSKAQTFEKVYTDIPMALGFGNDTAAFNDLGNCVKQTADGGFLMIGNQTDPLTTESNLLLIKTDQAGATQWKKYFGGYGDDFSRSAIELADGSYIITGGTNTIFAGGMDVLLIRIDSAGNEVWSKTFGGEGDEEGLSVKQTTDGGFIIAGKTNSYGAGNEDVYLIKTDVDGDLLWSKTFGGAAIEMGNSVILTSDGGYLIAGQTNSFGAGGWDMYVMKTDASGNQLWTKTIGGAEADIAKSAVETAEGGFVIAGSKTSFGDTDVCLLKISNSGTAVWTKTFGGINSDKANSVLITPEGGFIIAGETQSFGAGNADVYLIKASSGGNATWTRSYGTAGNDMAMYCEETPGGYITIGSSESSDGSLRFYAIRMDAGGNTTCSQNTTATIIATLTSTVADALLTIETTPSPVTGRFTSFLDGNNMLTVEVRCTSELAEENVSIDESVVIVADSAAEEEAVQRSFITENKVITVNVYPNPSAGQFYFTGLEAGCGLEIYNASGELIVQQTMSDDLETIDLTGRAKGFYFYRITDLDGQVQQAKILIQ